jgi:hypothetical protein
MSVTRVSEASPLTDGLDFSGWVSNALQRSELIGSGEVLVEGTTGPLIVSYQRGGLRALDIIVRPDPSISTLPLLPAFPLLLDRAVRDLAHLKSEDGRQPQSYRSGSTIRLKEADVPTLLDRTGKSWPLLALPENQLYELPEITGRFEIEDRHSERSEVTLSILDHPGAPSEAILWGGELPAFSPKSIHADLRKWLLVALLAALLAEVLLRSLSATP